MADITALLDRALATYRGQKRDFALSLRGRISVAIGEELGALARPQAAYRGRTGAPRASIYTPSALETDSRGTSRSRLRGPALISYKAPVTSYAAVAANAVAAAANAVAPALALAAPALRNKP